MATDQNTDALVDEMIDRQFTRRSVLKRAAVLGFSIPAVAGLLAACGSDDDDEEPAADDTEPTAATGGDSTPAGEGGGDAEDTPADAGGDETAADGGEETPEDAGGEETEEGDGGEAPAGEGEYGGKLVVAIISQPPSFDIHQVTGRGIQLAMWHVYESLFTWDADYQVTPQLAESYEASDDSLTHTITLRQGVPFHNGEEMKAADVVASINRWAELSPTGALLMESVEELAEVDEYTIEFTMSEPIGTVPQLLARGGQGAAIYPKSIVDAAGTDFVSEYIGTGPYSFTEFLADRYTLLSRFDDYVGLDTPSSGYAGAKAAYLDELEYTPVPDEAARVAGFQSGDYHYLEEVVADQIEQMQNDPNLVVQQLPPRSYGYIGLNHASGIFTDLKMRQAFQAALSVNEQGLASHGEGFFELGPGIMLPTTVWGESTAGAELYNQADPEKAGQLLEEAGYDGTPVRWLTIQEDLGDYNSAVVCQQQLQDAGFTVELTVVDEATLETNRQEKEGWDVWNGAFILRTDPTLLPYLSSCDYSGWWCSDEKEAAFESLLTETDFDTRYEAFETLQRLFYEEVGGYKQQNNYGIMTVSAKVKNFGPETTHFELEPEFTNCWLEEE